MSDSNSNMRVLVLDDRPALLEPMRDALREVGMKPEISTSFSDIAEYFNRRGTDELAAVLVDMHFCNVTSNIHRRQASAERLFAGLDIVRALVDEAVTQRRNRRVPIFITSALHARSEHLGEIKALSEQYGAEIRFLAKGLKQREFLEAISKTSKNTPNSLHVEGLVDVDGNPLRRDGAGHKLIVGNVRQINSELLKAIGRNPELMRVLSPREFEEFVAHLLEDMGYQVELTPGSKDGGFDIFAARRDGVGKFLYLVECKAYAEHHPVGVGVVRALNGVVGEKHASAGMVATTSRFTRGAQELERRLPYRLSLNDFRSISRWVDEYWNKRLS